MTREEWFRSFIAEMETTRNAKGFYRLPSIEEAAFSAWDAAFLAGEESGALRLESENRLLRKLLWLRHDAEHLSILYGDDGEMQCGACLLDFKRMSAPEIDECLESLGRAKMRAALSPGPAPTQETSDAALLVESGPTCSRHTWVQAKTFGGVYSLCEVCGATSGNIPAGGAAPPGEPKP